MRKQRRVQAHVGEVVLVAVFMLALFSGVGVNAFLTGQSSLFDDYGYHTPGAPTAPIDIVATAGDETVTVLWSAPLDEGASPITGYVVYLFSNGSLVDTIVVPAAVFAAQFTGLANGATYQVTVAALNAVAEGPQSFPQNVLPSGLPGNPTINTVTPGDETLTVEWAYPVTDGGQPITSFTVVVVEPLGAPAVPDQVVAGNIQSAVFTGLVNQQAYTFTVFATNENGDSVPSAPVSGTPNGPVVPGAPVINAAVPGDGSVTVHWTAPLSNGGAAITSYTITVVRSGVPAQTTVVTSPTSPVTITGLTNNVLHTVTVKAQNSKGFGPDSAPRTFTPNPAFLSLDPPSGYWLVSLDGGVFSFGLRDYFGSMAGVPLAAPVMGIASTPDGGGYWLVGADGGVFAFGNAGFHGSMAGHFLAAPIVGIVGTPDGGGYWLVGADGGVFAFGNAKFLGSLAGQPLNGPIMGIAAAPFGGYWLVGADGGVFALGGAGFKGSAASLGLNSPVVGIVPTEDGTGYWLVSMDGGVFAFNAPFHGAVGHLPLAAPVIGMAPVPGDAGYHLAALDGGVFALKASFFGTLVNVGLVAPVVGIA